MDPIRNPYAPGAGTAPPELAGRDRPLEAIVSKGPKSRPDQIGAHPKGMVSSPSHGDTAFTVPLFDEFILRVMPNPEDAPA